MQIDLYVNDEHEEMILEEYDTLAFDLEVDRLLEKIKNKINKAGSKEKSITIYIEEEED